MIYSVTTGGYAGGSTSFWETIFEPFRRLSTSISDKVSSSLDMLVNAEKYYNENIQLKSQLNEIYNEIIDYDKVKKENEDLRAMLELSEEYESFTFSPPCTVIARTTNDPFASFTVDKGSSDGIKPQDPVITSEGIVGVCYDVAESTCKVRTLYSPKTAIGVYSLRTRASGIIEGEYELAKTGLCRMNYIDKTSDIEVGDIIVTSGSANYPSSQLVGTVEEVGMEDSGLSMYALVRPAVDPATVSDVFVITGFEAELYDVPEEDTVPAAAETSVSENDMTEDNPETEKSENDENAEDIHEAEMSPDNTDSTETSASEEMTEP